MAKARADSDRLTRRGLLRASVIVGGGIAGSALASEPRPAARPAAAPLNVRAFGGAGDGRRLDTQPLQQAIDAAHRDGGGIVHLPAGRWLSGTLRLRSHVTLDLGPGAVLLASDDDDDFADRERPAFRTGSDEETIDFAHALIAAEDAERVAITGSGTIDMNRDERSGPKPIALKRCRFVVVRGITIRHAPNYCVSLGGCDDVLVDGVVIRDAYADGIDPDCCRRVRIANCDVESHDDALCLKASLLLGVRATTEDVVVTNCRLRSPSNCFKLGTESTGDFRRIALSNCVFSGLPPEGHRDAPAAEGGGVAILTVDGGTIDGVVVSNVVMEDVPAPLFVRLGNRRRDQVAGEPGGLRNVSVSGIVARGASETGSIVGLPGHPVQGITVENVRIHVRGGARATGSLAVPEREGAYPTVAMFGRLPAFGLYLRHARDVKLRGVELVAEQADRRPALVADDVAALQVAAFTGGPGRGPGPVVWLHDVRGGVVQASVAPDDVQVFLRVSGAATAGLALVGNAYRTAAPVDVAPEILPAALARDAAPSAGGAGTGAPVAAPVAATVPLARDDT
jgi:polygalacturonase